MKRFLLPLVLLVGSFGALAQTNGTCFDGGFFECLLQAPFCNPCDGSGNILFCDGQIIFVISNCCTCV